MVLAQVDVREALVVAQDDVEARPVRLMRLYSSSSASVSEFVTVTSMLAICWTSAWTFGSTLLGLK